MKLLWHISLVALLVLQAIASPVHAFAQELGHAHTLSNHNHHHNHDHDHHHDHDASQGDATDSHEHNCISHCHVSFALLGSTPTALPSSNANRFNYRASIYTEKFTEPIDRPQWLAARV